MRIQIRELVRDEVSALSRLAVTAYTAAFGHSFGADDLAAHLESNFSEAALRRAIGEDVVLVAAMQDRLVGFIQFGAARTSAEGHPRPRSEIRSLYVLPVFQRQGIGTLLLTSALQHPRLAEAGEVVLDVWEHNESAQRLYHKHGFRIVDSKRFTFASGKAGDRDFIMVREPAQIA